MKTPLTVSSLALVLGSYAAPRVFSPSPRVISAGPEIELLHSCEYTCDATDLPLVENGTLPPGILLSLVPRDAVDGGTNVRTECDQCAPCSQTSDWTFFDTTEFYDHVWAGSGDPPEGGGGAFRAHGCIDAEAYCDDTAVALLAVVHPTTQAVIYNTSLSSVRARKVTEV